MSGINGRRKGKTGEREVSHIIEAWWQPYEKDCKFKSTPLSGGWSSPDVRGHFKTAGDLVTTAKKFPFTIEVKRRENWNLMNLIDGKRSPVWGWWLQCQRAADEEKREPMMWFRKGREEWRVMLRLEFVEELARVLPDGFGGYSWTHFTHPLPEHGDKPALVFADKLLAVHPRVIVKVGASPMIKKQGSKYVVKAETGRKMGTYKTKGEAKERLRQVEAAKYAKAKR